MRVHHITQVADVGGRMHARQQCPQKPEGVRGASNGRGQRARSSSFWRGEWEGEQGRAWAREKALGQDS
jgi:hypothetical protein